MPGERVLDHPARLMSTLRSEREAQDLTLEWVADKVGVKRQSIHEFETGKSSPTEETLRKWLRALDLPQEWADVWVEWQISERAGKLLEERRGPRAASPEDIEAAKRYIRRLFGR